MIIKSQKMSSAYKEAWGGGGGGMKEGGCRGRESW